jgi:hypothetical protein
MITPNPISPLLMIVKIFFGMAMIRMDITKLWVNAVVPHHIMGGGMDMKKN